MKKFVLAIALCILLTACGADNVNPEIKPDNTESKSDNTQIKPDKPMIKASDYFAYTKDVHMIYKGTGNEYAPYDTYIDYLKDGVVQVRSLNGGTISVTVYKLEDSVIRKVFSQGETYFKYDYTTSSNQDEIIIKEPIQKGTSWTLDDGALRSITAVDKKVKTPAGDYKALEITTKRTTSTIRDYYVKDIGLVKSEFGSSENDVSVTSELEKIENGVPYKHNVKFYFPEFAKDRVVGIERNVAIFTNEDMKFKFQKELKTIPENSGLSKVLSANTSVLGSIIDEKNGWVTVDFSAELVKEMNAGTSFESMIIKSITNTFGNYYQKDKVVITLEGKPYESGHIMLKQGEYFTVDKQ